MLTYALFIVGLIFLIKGASLLVDGASSIAKSFNISAIVIGLTIVSFGTSAPELIVNIIASLRGDTSIAIGNILGSNMINIFLILGLSATIYPLTAKRDTIWKEIPLSFLAAAVIFILSNDSLFDGAIFSGLSRIDGLILLLFFTIFLYYTFSISKTEGGSTQNTDIKMSRTKSLLYILIGLIGLILGGNWIVVGAIKIAELFSLSQSLIGLTIVAIGTSLPELATSAVAAYKKESDIAIGNIVGSNIFNIFFILGVSAVINPLPNMGHNFDMVMVMSASISLFLAMFIGKKYIVERWQGILMILVYICYITFLIVNK